MNFNPNEHLMRLGSKDNAKDYLPVQWRLVWFRQVCPGGTIETELVHLDLEKECEEEVSGAWNQAAKRYDKVLKSAKGVAIFRATVRDGNGGVAVGTKMEKAVSFPDFLEKAETGAIGRALAALGYGTQFAPELNEEHRVVDSPVDHGSVNTNTNNTKANNVAPSGSRVPASVEGLITEQQITSIRKLSEYLEKREPEGLTQMSNDAGKKLIQQLTAEYRQSKSKQPA